jgi:hypothetical protein
MAPARTSGTSDDQRGFTGTIDDTHIEVDWPRSIGFFGALGVAVALDLVSMPIAVFVAAVPFLKMMNRPNAPKPQQFFSHLVDGAAKPVGGDSEGTVRWASHPRSDRAKARRAAPRRQTSRRRRSRAAA